MGAEALSFDEGGGTVPTCKVLGGLFTVQIENMGYAIYQNFEFVNGKLGILFLSIPQKENF